MLTQYRRRQAIARWCICEANGIGEGLDHARAGVRLLDDVAPFAVMRIREGVRDSVDRPARNLGGPEFGQ